MVWPRIQPGVENEHPVGWDVAAGMQGILLDSFRRDDFSGPEKMHDGDDERRQEEGCQGDSDEETSQFLILSPLDDKEPVYVICREAARGKGEIGEGGHHGKIGGLLMPGRLPRDPCQPRYRR